MRVQRRWALNRADLILGLLAATVGTIAALYLALRLSSPSATVVSPAQNASGTAPPNAIAVAILTAWLAILLACIGGVLKVTSTRQNLISLFASEIRAIQYGLAIMKMFDFWCALHSAPEQGPVGFADTPRKEDYFSLFHGVGNNIGNLHPYVVEAVVRFYTYLKMSRDGAAALHGWKEITGPAIRKADVEHVISLLTHSMLWGFIALDLMGFKARTQDRELLQAMERCYNSIRGPGALDCLQSAHYRSDILKRFFA
jgi:hypothetical protein